MVKEYVIGSVKGPKGDQGPKGDTGAQGPAGVQGPQGIQGMKGDAATLQVGATTTGAAGSNAQVTNSGTSTAAVMNFTIPRGAIGPQGPQGGAGPIGPAGPQGIQGNAGPAGPKGDTGTANIINNLTATAPGSALDAVQGKTLKSTIDSHTGDAVKHITAAERAAWNSKANISSATVVTLTAAGWNASTKIQTVMVAGITASSNGFIGLADTATDAECTAAGKAGIQKTGQGTNSITLKCTGTIPAINIPMAVLIIG